MSERTPPRAAYLGPEGTFSYFAGLEFLSGCVTPHDMLACPDFMSVFQSVADGRCELGLVPLENSLRGTVGQCFDLFLNHNVVMTAEFFARISLCLLSRTSVEAGEASKARSGVGALARAIRVVYSHPQPLAQSDGWLRTHLPGVPVVPMESTAAAARRAAAEPDAAAVGHWRLSELLGLHILARAVEDEPDNWTRFVVIARPDDATSSGGTPSLIVPGDPARPRDRTSLLFTLPDKPGALAAVLESLARANVNMRKLESRPLRKPGGGNWKYAFFVDVECDLRAPDHISTLHALAACCSSLRVLGSYPRGPELTAHLKQ